MKVLTYNCCAIPYFAGHIAERLERIGRAIDELDPDVVMLQELFFPGQLKILDRVLRRWPHRARHLLSWRRVAGGMAVYAKFPIRESRFFDFREQGSLLRFSVLARLHRKGFMEVRFADPDLRLVHAHLLANYWCEMDPKSEAAHNPYARYQARQLHQLHEHLHLTDDGAPLLVGGDLNVAADSPMFRGFLERSALRDEMEDEPGTSLLGKRYYRLPSEGAFGRRLDFVLSRRFGRRVGARYVLQDEVAFADGSRRALSDHYGVLVELEA